MPSIWNKDLERVLLLRELLRQAWQKALNEELGETPGVQKTQRFIETISGFMGGALFKEQVERNKGLEDNIQAVMRIKIANPPRPKIVEALACYLYDAPPADFDQWNERTWQDLAFWERFEEATLPSICSRLQSEMGQSPAAAPSTAAAPSGFDDPPLTFRLWGIDLFSLQQAVPAFILAYLAILALGFFSSLYLSPVPPSNEEALPSRATIGVELALSAIQVILLPTLLFLIYFAEGTEEKIRTLAPGIVRQTMEQFRVGWVGFWISMCFLYLWLTLKWGFLLWAYDSEQIAQRFYQSSWIFSDLINLSGGFFLYYMFYILDTPSIAYPSIPARNRSFIRTLRVVIALGLALFAGAVAERLYSGAFFVFALSVFHAVGAAMFVSSLSSHVFRFHRWVLPLLFLYAAIQAGWPAISRLGPGHTTLGIGIVLLALILKGILMWDVSYKIRKDDFAGYITTMNAVFSNKRQSNEGTRERSNEVTR